MLKKVPLVGFLIVFSTVVSAQVRVDCKITSSDESSLKQFFPQPSSLDIQSIDISNGFRFSAILNQNASKFKTYVYYDSKNRYVLISKQEFQPDKNQCGKILSTGETYSPRLENHLTYECIYICNQ